VNFKKSSSHELAVETLWYIVNFAHKNKICPKMAPLVGASFYIGLYVYMYMI